MTEEEAERTLETVRIGLWAAAWLAIVACTDEPVGRGGLPGDHPIGVVVKDAAADGDPGDAASDEGTASDAGSDSGGRVDAASE